MVKILAIDIGNTNITFGVFNGKRLIKEWRAVTGSKIDKGLAKKLKGTHLDGVIVGSVVPEIDKYIRLTIRKLTGVEPLFVTHKNAGIKIGYSRPHEVGADRLINVAGAYHKYKKAMIIIDFGTATTLDYINKKGTYFGGAIAPGIGLANSILFERTSKLPRARIKVIKKTLPSSTVEAMQIGVYQGYIGLVERLVKKMVAHVGGRPRIIATGGLAKLISKGTDFFDSVEPSLTLEGLLRIYNLIKKDS